MANGRLPGAHAAGALLKLTDAWTDLGEGDFSLHYVRDKEKREVDFLITESRKPWLLVEAKLSDRSPSPALSYFAERLRPTCAAVQIVRHAPGGPVSRGNVLVTSAERGLACM